MSRLVLLGLVLGTDNMRVAFGIAAAGLRKASALRMVAAFALVETVMPVVGLAFGLSLRTAWGRGWTRWVPRRCPSVESCC